MIEEALLADEMGFAIWGASEQHFIPGGMSTVSAPEVLFGAVAAQTTQIKIRHMSTVMLTFNHPVRVAERLATLDVISNGRAQMAAARCNVLETMEAFEVSPDETRAQWAEGIELVMKALARDPFEHDGKYWHVPPRSLIPKAVDGERFPIFTPAQSHMTHQQAAQMGIGVLTWDNCLGWDYLAESVAVYRGNLAEKNVIGNDYVNDTMTFLSMNSYCAESEAEAREIGGSQIEAIMGIVVWAYTRMGEEYKRMGKSPEEYQYMLDMEAVKEKFSDFDYLNEHSPNMMIGTPATLIERFKRLEEMGCDEIVLRLDGYEHEQIMRMIELIGKEVIPKVDAHAGSLSPAHRD
jgi:alkanesulfonate monooxygenase SsuD/methylene tetrahydromethanopterin reductase-like flavin-dependent oxidoreductase (luciferase family)